MSTCICRVVVPALAVLPLRGALPFREPAPPKPSTTTRHCLDFLGSSLPFVLSLFFSFLFFSTFFPPSPLLPYLDPPSAHISLQPCHLPSSVWNNSNDSRRCPDPVQYRIRLSRSFPNITIFLSLLTSSSFILTSLQIFQSPNLQPQAWL